MGTKCKRCGEKFFPPRKVCPNCRRKVQVEEFEFSGKGEIYSYTVIYAAPEGFEYEEPYVMAMIKLEEGTLITAQVVDCDVEEVEIGKKVENVFRKVRVKGESGSIRYGYKFKLVNSD